MKDTISIEEIEKIRNTGMLLIFGKDRSGTSLLQSVLNAHPVIVAPPESKFMMVLYPRFKGIKHWTEKNVYDFIEEVYHFPAIKNTWNLDKELATKYLLAARKNLDYSLALKILYYVSGGKDNVVYLSDKRPGYYLFTKKLFNLFPDAKFIHIVREPRDNILSTFATFGANNTIYLAYKWLAINKIVEILKKEMPGRGITIQYEKIVETPDVVFKSICDFLNIPFNPDMLDRNLPATYYKNKNVGDISAKEQNKLFAPISTSSIGKWEKDLKPYDIAIIEKIAGPYAHSQYGYNMESSQSKNFHISNFKLIKGKYIYYLWQAFTRLRYNSYRINKFYYFLTKKGRGVNKTSF